jgi:hypothetical protein
MRWGTARRVSIGVAVAVVGLTGCMPVWVQHLAGDDLGGRAPGSAGSAAARAYVIDRIRDFAPGAAGGVGDARYLQPYPGGTNVVATIRGTDEPDRFVVVGAHYDGRGADCPSTNPADAICNGATDDASGVAALIQLAISLGRRSPRLSVVVAFWDGTGQGRKGSSWYVDHPLVPLADTVAYVDLDTLGANLSPGLRDDSTVIGAESGGQALVDVVQGIGDAHRFLTIEQFTAALGGGLGDRVSFVDRHIPALTFTDGFGPCRGTAADELDVVDQEKLGWEAEVIESVVRQVATDPVPRWSASPTLPTQVDAATALGVLDRAAVDVGLLSPADRDAFAAHRAAVAAIADLDPGEVTPEVRADLAAHLAAVGELWRGLPCRSYVPDT